MPFITLVSVLVSFILSAIFCPILIPVLRKLKFGQQVREEGNPEHLKKKGTPTMGGIAFLAAFLLAGIGVAILDPAIIPCLLLTVSFGVIGFVDDYLKVVKKQSEGFKAWQKLICQFLVTGAFAVYCYCNPSIGPEVYIPFGNGTTWNMGWLYIPFVFLAVLGTDNGVNFTDGLDGLCSSVTIIVSFFFAVVGISFRAAGFSALAGAMMGALMGFLLFNAYPAKVFMGDTGSLALGGFVASFAISMKMGWFILLFGLIYLVEVISVIMQVSYFKLTHGKRIFKMAPIHHHFELCGYSETQIVVMFSIVTILLSFIAYIAL